MRIGHKECRHSRPIRRALDEKHDGLASDLDLRIVL
jgi:hypothetical protein